jgi:hypothetical protein
MSGRRRRRPPWQVLVGVVGLAASFTGYLHASSGIRLTRVLAPIAGTAGSVAAGGLLAVALWGYMQRSSSTAAKARLEVAKQRVSDPDSVGKDAELGRQLAELTAAAAADVATATGQAPDSTEVTLVLGEQPDRLVYIRHDAHLPAFDDAARAAWSVVATSGAPEILRLGIVGEGTATDEPLLAVPLVADGAGTVLGALIARGLAQPGDDPGTKAAVSTLLSWARLASIMVGRKQPTGNETR